MRIPAILFLLLSLIGAQAQTSDNAFQRPLMDVLEDLMGRYQVQIKYKKEEIQEFTLAYANWRLVPGDVEESLKNVLAPFDYTYVTQGEGVFKIKPYQYHLITPEAGAASLEYLKTQYADKVGWESRRSELVSCIKTSLGLNELTGVQNPRIILSKSRKYDGYQVQNIALETIPGLFAFGSIYLPAKMKGKVPVIISPNGHFGDGRYNKDIQIRAAQLARMGAIVATYDLFGWGESELQVGGPSHRKSVAQQVQVNNSIKMLDYLLTLKNADSERVGITGGSGGGSMTMLMSAIDDRIKVSVPVVMTSSFHSGGCPCESGMPIHLCGDRTNNAEIAAIFAPKPQLIISDGGDWTFQVPEVEFPFIERTYSFYEAGSEVKNVHFGAEGHDYGATKRKAMYTFMAEQLGLKADFDESGITVEDASRLQSFGEVGKLPDGSVKSLEELYEVLNRSN